jgi:predicted transcriptional regulator
LESQGQRQIGPRRLHFRRFVYIMPADDDCQERPWEKMPRIPQDVTDAELALLQLLWDHGPSSVRRLAEQMYDKSSASQHATVQKLLERLEAKGCVRRDRGSWPHTFAAAIERGELIDRKLQQTADKLCDGSIQPLLTHLVKGAKLSADERQSLRDLLDGLGEEKNEKEIRKPGKK